MEGEKGGTRPGMKNANLQGPGINQEKEWRFRPNIELTALEKKRLLAHVIAIGVRTVFDTHVYQFGGEGVPPTAGGPNRPPCHCCHL